MILWQAIQNLFNDIRDAAQTIAPVVAIIGFMSLSILYLDSSWSIVADWKRDSPKAANYV